MGQAILVLVLLAHAASALGLGMRGLARREEDSASTLGLGVVLAGLAVAPMTGWHAPFWDALGWAAVVLTVLPIWFVAFDGHRLTQALLGRWRSFDPDDMEIRRKTPHILLGLLIPAAWYVAPWLLATLSISGWEATRIGFGIGPELALGFLLFLVFLLLPIEWVRLAAPDTMYPWRKTILRRLRDKERHLVGAHVHIGAGLALAVWFTADYPGVPQAIIAVAVLADAAMALVGRRWGRHKWFHDPRKSLEGSLAGFVVACLVAWPFVGPMAIAMAGVLVILDAASPRLLPMTDNLLHPIGLALLWM